MNLILAIFVFALGAIIGSFLNAYTFRYNTGLSMITRSKCMSCNTTISWYDLIPGISFFILRGRCRVCYTKISKQYPLVEIFLGLLFLGTYLILGATLEFVLAVVIFSVLMAILIYDARHKIIPNHLVYLFILLSVISLFIKGNIVNILFFSWGSIITGVALFMFFFFLWFFSKGRWMGLGDAKLALGIGIFLGVFRGISAIILGFWVGSIISLLILAIQKLKNKKGLSMKSEIPFAPFLLIGLWLVFFFNISIFNIGL